ncbi:Glutamate synthase [NADPH] large chain [Chitinispirillum alkaliphilum]|nr:Glutamate synthase [NADPH] large chain [Chitinispirillum alkaliphilum]
MSAPKKQGLYDPANEHDACGVGFVVNIDGRKSHDIIKKGIDVLKNLLHRGGTGADANTGDGAGLLFDIPEDFFRIECKKLEIALPDNQPFGVGMCFLPSRNELCIKAMHLAGRVAKEEGLTLLGWREVPVDAAVLGETARREMPSIRQCFLSSPGLDKDELERKLYIMRKSWQALVCKQVEGCEDFYIPSLSCRTIVYKGLMQATQVSEFYLDLMDKRLESAVAVVHQRYSTNTFPSWQLAQPFRCIAHNGEINTIKGNRLNMEARENNLVSDRFGDNIKKLLPIVESGGSDSAALDNVLELLTAAGRDMHHAAVMLIPQGWGTKYLIGPDLRGFFEYHAGIMEPWDGPAAVAFTDGCCVGGLLDRNGLRPARYTVTKDRFMVFASEAGVIDFEPDQVVEKGSLRPGEIILVDTSKGRVLKDHEIKMALARKKPYRRWVEENRIDIYGLFDAVRPQHVDASTLRKRHRLFGYTREDEQMILNVMASSGNEPKGSMGSDQPLALFSENPKLLYWYFKQMFAQVTNPPIDPIREELVMSLMTGIGNTDSILAESAEHARLIKMPHPILLNQDLERICTLPHKDFGSNKLKAGFLAGGDGKALVGRIETLCDEAVSAVKTGSRILILSDRDLDKNITPIPMLLVVAAVHRRLITEGLRTRTGLIVETAEAREVMHMALLLGYGASAINPYLAFETIAWMAENGKLDRRIHPVEAVDNYIKSLCSGILRIISKMGISTLRSYRSAQIFEAIGLGKEVIDRYFQHTPSRIGGLGFDEIAFEANARHTDAYDSERAESTLLPSGGIYRYRKDGERHMWTPRSISLLQRATRENDRKIYDEFSDEINNQSKKLSTLRGLFRIKETGVSIPLSEVEPASEIVKRFVTGAMSFGSISREAHRTLAIAMNRLGGMSNSGEGGEEAERFLPLPNGDSVCSAIKQVASGRFGVTIEYLVNARELQIKIAQGAKPGEGGHLPGHKVTKEIAAVRHSTPGITLISPPPHHDIYSIEDIAQLIYDLKNANPKARVSVKLVSECGVGTVAAGLAKGHADLITISGGDGGTGAAPLSSIKHSGLPWEMGLSEAQQTLMLNGLRSRVRLQTDGQLRTGRDVLIAALLGAEEYGFATAPLVVCGCLMMRKCHSNACPVGVATQDPELRKLYSGKPEYVQNYFMMVAEELRGYMAGLGFRSVDEMVGRSDLLKTDQAVDFWKAKGIDLSGVFYQPDASFDKRRCVQKQNHGLDKALDYTFLEKCKPAIWNGDKVCIDLVVRNIHRTVGTILSGEIAKQYGAAGLPDDTITLNISGTAGQSFAAFGARGITFILSGETNDYAAKGLSGAKVIIKPPEGSKFDSGENVIAGNVLLYGATSGEVYINGRAGERFAIRNSGATAVVEGIGDHGCEYMTGGRVVVLGSTGVNFGAGMSGGIAYVFDKTGQFDSRCNLDLIDLERLEDFEDQQELFTIIQNHVSLTGSKIGKQILERWDEVLPFFIKVIPMEYRRVLQSEKTEAVTVGKEGEHE